MPCCTCTQQAARWCSTTAILPPPMCCAQARPALHVMRAPLFRRCGRAGASPGCARRRLRPCRPGEGSAAGPRGFHCCCPMLQAQQFNRARWGGLACHPHVPQKAMWVGAQPVRCGMCAAGLPPCAAAGLAPTPLVPFVPPVLASNQCTGKQPAHPHRPPPGTSPSLRLCLQAQEIPPPTHTITEAIRRGVRKPRSPSPPPLDKHVHRCHHVHGRTAQRQTHPGCRRHSRCGP